MTKPLKPEDLTDDMIRLLRQQLWTGGEVPRELIWLDNQCSDALRKGRGRIATERKAAKQVVCDYLNSRPEIVALPDPLEDIRAMCATATKKATELRELASDIQRAAETIASIARDDSRSNVVDGPEWERAAKILHGAGIDVPQSSHYTWST
jgi:hypothetical protein